MTSLDTKESSPGFFTIYKPGQGKYVRWGTVVGLVLVLSLGMYWIDQAVMIQTLGQTTNYIARAVVQAVIGIGGALLTFMVVNRPRLAEFMIMTESELNKVTWPSRASVIRSTKVVIVLTLLLALILWLVDVGFKELFQWIKVL